MFTARAVEQLRERTQQIANQLLDKLGPREPVDLVESYCGLLPVTVISEILGVPPQDHGRVLSFGAAGAPSLDFGLGWRASRGVETALAQFDAWLGDHLDYLRRNPGTTCSADSLPSWWLDPISRLRSRSGASRC
ncbi:hypothetical protein [Kibdelosporangium aridum]|uniref:hypothetical protein n=1 Tax=Kibdelosporangium aridum TaxID=2030 RepID=UPI00056B0644